MLFCDCRFSDTHTPTTPNTKNSTRSDCSGEWNSKKTGLFATTTGSIGADYTTAGGAGTVKGAGYSEGAVQCQTIFVKPILACPQYCITDFRSYGDKCFCPNGVSQAFFLVCFFASLVRHALEQKPTPLPLSPTKKTQKTPSG